MNVSDRERPVIVARFGAVLSVFILACGAIIELLAWSRPSGELAVALIAAAVAAPLFIATAHRLSARAHDEAASGSN
jgi:uncharacterized membrane protein